MTDEPRAALAALAAARGESLAALSRLIGRNAAYLQQFVTRGSPRRLDEADRRTLAAYLGVSEVALGGPAAPPAPVRVPRLAARASAGSGALVEEARAEGGEALDPALLRALGLKPGACAILTAEGDSMAPTIHAGDELLIDAGDREGEGLFVLRREGALLVKRVVQAPGGWQLLSDNPAYPPQSARGAERIGRVVRLTRRLR